MKLTAANDNRALFGRRDTDGRYMVDFEVMLVRPGRYARFTTLSIGLDQLPGQWRDLVGNDNYGKAVLDWAEKINNRSNLDN